MTLFIVFFCPSSGDGGRNSLCSSGDSSSAFSDCNSDRLGEFPTTSAHSRRLLVVCASENFDDQIRQLVSDLESGSLDLQRQAAMVSVPVKENRNTNTVVSTVPRTRTRKPKVRGGDNR
uniref:Uncharacterized protein n=1 Tax=Nelumbo nucifera TaxID=4432 RepID=A0A822ZYU5_NELNU|nr:TPA_asm: hypothetical protein HUJ06_017943 [Nelumbo nucifera]